MSKYRKLDGALAPTMHDDDFEESFSLYSDDNQKQLELDLEQRRDSSDHITLNIVGADRNNLIPNGGSKHGNNNNHITIGSTRTTSGNVDLEEHTWEVPLLRRDSNNSCSNLHLEHEIGAEGSGEGLGQRYNFRCRTLQPGFGENLRSKSAQEAKFKIILAISLCVIFMIIEFLGGFMAGSLAIMADAAHLASDCISFVIGLVAIWLGSRPPDARMSFGYKRFEVLGALASVLGIWLVTAMLVMIAIERIYSQDFQLDVNVMMCISAIGIVINIIMMFVLHGSWFLGPHSHGHGHSHSHSHSHNHSHSRCNMHGSSHEFGHSHAHATDSRDSGSDVRHNVITTNGLKAIQQSGSTERNLNLRAAMVHVIGDLVQSIGVFLAAVLIKFYPAAKFVDPLCTLLFSVIVIMTTIRLFRDSVSILLDAVPRNICLTSLQAELSAIEGVKSVHHLNVWQHTSEHYVLMAHLVLDLLSDSDVVLEQATSLASSGKYNIKHVTIQVERLTE